LRSGSRVSWRRSSDDPDVQVLERQQDGLPGVLAADADVVELAGVAEGDGSDGPYLVGADAVVGVGGAVAGGGFGPGGVRGQCQRIPGMVIQPGQDLSAGAACLSRWRATVAGETVTW
jgi:hypothetical protein